jgi:serine/threonine protein phosphatase PrpC
MMTDRGTGDMVGVPCPGCGDSVFADDEFCEACGWSLTTDPGPQQAQRAQQSEQPPAQSVTEGCAECGGTTISADGYCDQCGLRQPSGREHVEIELPAAAGVSDKGLRYSRNEDAMAVTTAAGRVVAVVCDGVSSGPRPEDASRVGADTGLAMVAAQLAAGADPESATRAGLTRAAKAVAALADSAHDAPACTYVSAIVDADAVTVGWTGDSRVYWISAGDGGRPSATLTVDDSWATHMVAMGVLTAAEANADRRAHTVTAWLGADAGQVRPRAETFEPGGGGVIVLCTDGLWNYLPEPAELAEAVHRAKPGGPPLDVARSLVQTALDAGGHDNVTVVLIPFPPVAGMERS